MGVVYLHSVHMVDGERFKVARVYLRVSTDGQDLTRQLQLVEDARARGYYVAGVYREKASGTRADRPELLRLIEDLQPHEVVIAERMDRISRLPLIEAEKLVAAIKNKGARLSVPGLVDLSDVVDAADGVAKVVMQSVQDLLLKVALQLARDDYELRRERQAQGIRVAKEKGVYKGRKPDELMHARILAVRKSNTIEKTAEICGCSIRQVSLVCAKEKNNPHSIE